MTKGFPMLCRSIPLLATLLSTSFFFTPLFLPALAAQTKNSEHTLKLDEGASSPAAQIEALSWLAGYWRGEGLGGECEELWGNPIGDRMVGSFRYDRDDVFIFSEAMMLVEEEGTLILKLKHFHPDFAGWEEKDDFVSFPLVRLGDQEAFFSGLTFRRVKDSLEVYVVIKNEGKAQEYAFQFERASL